MVLVFLYINYIISIYIFLKQENKYIITIRVHVLSENHVLNLSLWNAMLFHLILKIGLGTHYCLQCNVENEAKGDYLA